MSLTREKGLSKHCKGKSQSFSNLKEIEEQGTMIEDTEEKENPLNEMLKLDDNIADQAKGNEGDNVQKQLNEDENIADDQAQANEEHDDTEKLKFESLGVNNGSPTFISSDDEEYFGNQYGNMAMRTKHKTAQYFYKTRVCSNFNHGECRHGEMCIYAHGKADLRGPHPHWRNHRTRICYDFMKKKICRYGENCIFDHPAPRPIPHPIGRRPIHPPLPQPIRHTFPHPVPHTFLRPIPHSFPHPAPAPPGLLVNPAYDMANWKTQPCYNMPYCPFRAEDCPNAHSNFELRNRYY